MIYWSEKKGEIISLIFMCSLLGCSTDTELQWQEESGYRWAELPMRGSNETGFQKMKSNVTGITFVNSLPQDKIIENQNLLNGSGVAAGDVDGDGLIDLYFAHLDGPNKLYKNMGGFRFKDITEEAGVAHEGYYSTGVLFADVNGDAAPDLLITSLEQENILYINDGEGHFERKENSGLDSGNGSMSMAMADIDGDEYLDLYIVNYKRKSVKDLFEMHEIAWENTVIRGDGGYQLIPPFDDHFYLINNSDNRPERRELGTEDELYINQGDGTFQKVEDTENYFFSTDGNPKSLERDWGLTAKFQDINNDGFPDLYVCNDFWTPDRIWINQKDGTFKEADKLAIRNMSFSSMGVDFSDINRDGNIDIFVTEMLSPYHEQRNKQMITYSPFPVDIGEFDNQPQYMRNTLHLNRGDGTFAEIARFSNVQATGWSWAANFLDVDLDGYEDLVITTGHQYDVLDIDTQRKLSSGFIRPDKGYILNYPSLKLRNVALRNNGDLTFSDKSEEWGFDEDDISHGMAIADLDNDGYPDIVINRLNNEAAVLKNVTSAPRLAVRLRGNSRNPRAIGAEIKLIGGPVEQTKQLALGGSYLSGSDPMAFFAADKENNNHKLVISWSDGKKTTLEGIRADRIYEIDEQETIDVVEPSKQKETNIIFEDVSEHISFIHKEEDFDDFRMQPLLPLKLSRLGPGVALIDIDGDNNDDLVVGNGKGGDIGLFENLGDGRFEPIRPEGFGTNEPGDVTGIVGWREEENSMLFVGSSNYEQRRTALLSGFQYSIYDNKVTSRDTIPHVYSTTGPLAAADYNGDGTVDLFLGGRFIPTQYPRNADSRLFRNEKGRLFLDEKNSEIFAQAGLVTSAVFTDYNVDSYPDLLLSTEWGSLKLFINLDGEFHEVTESAGLNQYKGWWNGVATGDFNNDGSPDFIATNLGMNSGHKMEEGYPLKFFYDDFDRDNDVEIVESYYNSDMDAYVPRRSLDELRRGIPAIVRNVRSYEDFAQSSLQKLLGIVPDQIPNKEINTLKHMVFLNDRNGSFTAHPLPDEAQFTAAFYAGVADFNNDGNEDIFISQNLFALPEFTSRLDAGRGLWLEGDGTGKFKAVRGQDSGIKVYGEQRGAALGDLNSDGRVDLVVSQNAGPLKIFLNRTSRRGLIVRLKGPESNQNGIGSSMQLIYDDGSIGPSREIQAGSGYWSQNSSTQIMGIKKGKSIKKIEIKWFDGKRQVVKISPENNRYVVKYPTDLQN